jgi:toxin FitB
MPYLVDTNVLSEARKKANCDPGVAAWFGQVEPDELYLSVLCIGEVRRGIELRRAKDPATAGHLEKWLAGLETHYADRIIPVSPAVADRWGRLCPAQPLPAIDGLLAATCVEHKLTIVTRNTADFERAGVPTLNPFKGG